MVSIEFLCTRERVVGLGPGPGLNNVVEIPIQYGGKPASMLLIKNLTDQIDAEEKLLRRERTLLHAQKIAGFKSLNIV